MIANLRDSIRELAVIFRGNVGVIAISWLLFSITGALVNPFFAKYAKDLGASDYDVAVIRSLGMLALALSLVPGGLITDYFGRVKPILVGTGLVALSQFLYAVAPDWRVLMVVYVVDMASHFYQPALTAIIMDSLQHGVEFKGFLGLNIVSMIPGLFMPIVGGFLYEIVGVSGIRIGFALQGIVATVVLILRIKALKETFRPLNKDFSKLVLELAGYRGVLSRALKLYVYTSILLQLALGVPNTYMALYAMDVLGLSKPLWGVLSAASTLGSMLALLALISKRNVSRGRLALAGSATASLSLVLAALAYYVNSSWTRFALLFACSTALGISLNVVQASISATLTQILPVEVRGRATGIQRLLDNVGAAASSYIAAHLYTRLGHVESFITSSSIGLVATAYLYTVLARTL